MSVLSPKMFFPITLMYKIFKDINNVIPVKDLMKTLCNLFFNIIKDVLWIFIKMFWGFIKKDLLEFVATIALEF